MLSEGVTNQSKFMNELGEMYEAHYNAVNTTMASVCGDGLSLYNKSFRTLAGRTFLVRAYCFRTVHVDFRVSTIRSFMHLSIQLA